MSMFTHKGYGRIFVEKESDIELVKSEIKNMSDFEYEYLPEKLITVFPDGEKYLPMTYTHKFSDLNMDHLSIRLWKKGIRILWIDNGHGEYFTLENQ